MFRALRAAIALAGLLLAVAAIPSPGSLGSDLRLIFQNDLNWSGVAEHQGAILLSPRSYSAAVSDCSELGEAPLVPTSPYFKDDFSHSLAYLSYSGQASPRQTYWIASAHGSCRAVGPACVISAVDCSSKLPVLCSQSAPFHVTGAGTVPSLWNLNPPSSPKWEVQVQSDGLTVTGTRDQLSFRFLGIPFANNPERFTYSTLYSGPPKITATSYGPPCVQAGVFANGSENCLFLNVYTSYLPKSSPPAKSSLKPVLFFMYGGGFNTGTGSDPSYDGGALASRGDVVVVTMNYRLSTLGFLALNDGVHNGNYGISDQVTALSWVQKYITAFGGDPDRVTISGQSSGAVSVRILLASPKAIGKFAAGIMQSDPVGPGPAAGYTIYPPVSQAFATISTPILAATGCNGTNNSAVLACLKSYDAVALVNLAAATGQTVVDGTYITTPELPLDGSAPIAKVPVIMGNMRDDAAGLIPFPPAGLGPVPFIEAVLGYSADTVTSLLASGLFPEPTSANTSLNVFNVTSLVGTAAAFRCLDQATVVAAVNKDLFGETWYYQFNRSYQLAYSDPNFPVCTPPVDAAHPYGDPSKEYFHCHGGDLYYVFGTLGRAGLPYRDANDQPFTEEIMDRWTSFVRTHNPNPDPAYLAARGYANTAAALSKYGRWLPLSDPSKPTMRIFTVPGVEVAFSGMAQCNALNLSLSYFNSA